MTVLIQRAICIAAIADDLKFLSPIRKALVKRLGVRMKEYELLKELSHEAARQALVDAKDGIVLVFAHGTGDYIRGGEYRSRVQEQVIATEKFITKAQLEAFRGKVVFCLSCDSALLAAKSIEAGALAFVGFGEVPFRRFNEDGTEIVNHELTLHTQRLIAASMSACLGKYFDGSFTLKESVAYLRLWVCRKAIDFVRSTQARDRRDIGALFLRVKDGVQYFGQDDVRFDP